MRVAYLMNGLVGGLTGKNCQRTNDEIAHLILEYCAKTHKHLHNENVEIDYFIFSWEPHLDDVYKKLFNPKGHISSEQITFDVSPTLQPQKNNLRVQSHYSRWYGAKKVFELCEAYANKNNFEYDLVINARIDLFYHNNIDLAKFDTNIFHVATAVDKPKYNWPNSHELTDHIFVSNQSNAKEFYQMFDKLEDYTRSGQCPSWNYISSHMLAVWHLKKIGLLNKDTIRESITTRYSEKNEVDYHIFRCLKLTEIQIKEGLKD